MTSGARATVASKPAAFFDRDGVLNVDRDYVHRVDQLEWIEGAAEAIKLLNDAGYLVIVVTNQSGVARGLYDEAAIGILHAHMQAYLAAHGARIDAFYYCPHHPQGKVERFAINCACRKPGTGMLEQAAADWSIDRAYSFMIGDKDIDLAAATAFNIRGAKFNAATDSLPALIRRMIGSG
ncbi:MAG: HAD family hydrolase [Proteobacteria bacterium]|nr:HAD family hydrolase [Pseudomonadota bacterium]